MGAEPLMAGNSQRRGRSTGAGKKTASAGTGGKNRRSLVGRGATPPAEAEPDLEVPDLESLVHALGVRGS